MSSGGIEPRPQLQPQRQVSNRSRNRSSDRSRNRSSDRSRNRNHDLHSQARRAASSVSLNIAEGRRRSGKDRQHFFRIAAGSADELRTALRIAIAWGYVASAEIDPALQRIDRVLAMLWRMTH